MTDEERLVKQGRIPIQIQFMSLFYPIIDYSKMSGEDYVKDIYNESKGEIFKFNLTGCDKGKTRIGEQLVGRSYDSKGDYDAIWIHLGSDWFKLTSKTRNGNNHTRNLIRKRINTIKDVLK
jgi:hypothetical protein